MRDENLKDGLYAYRDGSLTRIDRDENDNTFGIRISSETNDKVKDFQKILRPVMGGLRPDKSDVCEALLKMALCGHIDAVEAVCAHYEEKHRLMERYLEDMKGDDEM